MMFYFEESTRIKKAVPQDDKILILDGTTCLDYLVEEPDFNNKKNWLQLFFKQLTTFVKSLT